MTNQPKTQPQVLTTAHVTINNQYESPKSVAPAAVGTTNQFESHPPRKSKRKKQRVGWFLLLSSFCPYSRGPAFRIRDIFYATQPNLIQF